MKNKIITQANQTLLSNHLLETGIILLLFSIVLSPEISFAQQDSLKAEEVSIVPVEELNLVSVTSKPSGALVRIKGEYSFVGRTPFTVPYPLQGRYRIQASKPGYETEKSSADFLPNEQSSIVIKLTPKSRWKAGFRSILFPGWGQYYSGEKMRGFVYSAAQIGFLIGTAIAINKYQDSKNELDRAVEIFENNLDETSFQDVQDKLLVARNDHDSRNTMFYITAGLWALNILDSIIFFSSDTQNIQFNSSSTFSKNYDGNKVMLTWKIGL